MFKWISGIAKPVPEDGLPIGPNLKIDLHVRDGEYAGQYHSRVEDIRDGFVLVAIPQERGVTVPIREGVRVTVRYSDPFGLYQFDTRIVSRILRPVPALALDRPVQDDIQCVLRRSFPRYECEIIAVFRVVDSPDVYYPGASHRVRTLDLSAGGFSFEHAHRIPEDSRLRMDIQIPGDESALKTDGQVVRCRNLPNRRQTTYEIGVKFQEINPEDRARLMQYIKTISGPGSRMGRR